MGCGVGRVPPLTPCLQPCWHHWAWGQALGAPTLVAVGAGVAVGVGAVVLAATMTRTPQCGVGHPDVV